MKTESIISFYDRESIEATEFRRLYSNINNSNKEKLRSLMVTSSVIEEGKSTISSYLALSIAESSTDKILLLDADLRRPMINVFFKLPLKTGMADILQNKCSIKQAIKTTPITNLSIITAGKLTGDPAMILNQKRLGEIFEELKFYFDFIIIDVPPIMPVSDPLIIANEVDAVIVVVRAGKTPREVAKRAVNFLNNSKINVLGTVLNNIEEVLPYYYNSKYYSYKYYNRSDQNTKK